MPIRTSRFYNNEDVGNAMSNIAAMFAPPDSGDMANYALARGRNQQNDIIAKLAMDPANQSFDRQSIIADLYDPTQSFYRVDQDNATARRGQDISASTSRANNAADNQRAFITSMFGPVNEGQIRPEVSADIAGMFGVNSALPSVAGTPKPRSETEVRGGMIQDLRDRGLITDENLMSLIMSDVNAENVVGPDGKPVVVPRSQAFNREPYFNPSAAAKPENAMAILSNGTRVPARQNTDGVWVHAQTNEVLPPDVQVVKMPNIEAQTTGDAIGIGKPTANNIDQRLVDLGLLKNSVTQLASLIKSSPASQGVVGAIRGTAQNIIQTGGELGQMLGGTAAEVAASVRDGLLDANIAADFDPNIPAIEALGNTLAFQYAKAMGGDRMSNEMYRNAKQSLGLDGWDANQATTLAKLQAILERAQSEEQYLYDIRQGGISRPTREGNDPINGEARLYGGTRGLSFDPATLPEGVTPEDVQAMTPEERRAFGIGS